jgi:hypothetical protein
MIGCNKKSSSSPSGELKKKDMLTEKGHLTETMTQPLDTNPGSQHPTCMLGVQNLRNGALPSLARL